MPGRHTPSLARITYSSAIFLAACSGSGSGSPPTISVSLSPTSATVQVGGTAKFAAAVSNDLANKGVTWSVSCALAPCGSVSPTVTVSGATTTYTTSDTLPPNDLKVMLTATSVTDPTKTAFATITVPAVLVSVSPTSAVVPAGQIQQLAAIVSGSGGANWTVSCPAAQCGTISPAFTTSFFPAIYMAPATAPTSNLTVTVTATSISDAAAFASATITIPATIVSISPSSAAVPLGGAQQFTAAVSGDPSSGGVTWTVVWGLQTCNNATMSCDIPSYPPCSPACGAVSPISTTGSAPTTYTAPAHFTSPATQPCDVTVASCTLFLGVFLQANSVADGIAFDRAGITFPPISVSLSVPSVSVVVSATQQFAATVTNDATGSGLTWTLTQNGAACSPGCGTINSTSTASGEAVTYTAPANVPALAVLTITATSANDTRKSASATVTVTTPSGAACGAGAGSESLLKGQYAFVLRGFDSGGVVVMAGSIVADGTGRITAGEEDSNSTSTAVTDASIDPTASFYFVGPDHRGCLALAVSGRGTTYFRFALGVLNSSNVATAGNVIEFDDTTGTGTRLAGAMRLQDATSFTVTQFKGNYVIGLNGTDQSGALLAIGGTFVSDGASAIPSGTFDINDAGTLTNDLSLAPGGSFTCCSSNGRGTLTLQINTTSFTPILAFYMISASDAFLVNRDGGQYSGEAFGISSGTTFSQASLDGPSVIRETGRSSSNGPVVGIATASADGTGSITKNDNVNSAGTFTSSSTLLHYVVDSNGRVTLTGGTSPVLYLFGQNQGFLVGTDANVTFGIMEPHAAGPFSDASLSGAYKFGAENPMASTVTMESGIMTPDGVGNTSGTSDQSSSTGLAQNQSFNSTYSISANGTGNFGTGTTAILISGNKLVFINNTSANPTITAVEK